MATLTVKLRTRAAWWVRPALAIVFLVGRISTRCAGCCIDIIVDKGISVELA